MPSLFEGITVGFAWSSHTIPDGSLLRQTRAMYANIPYPTLGSPAPISVDNKESANFSFSTTSYDPCHSVQEALFLAAKAVGARPLPEEFVASNEQTTMPKVWPGDG